MLCLKRTTPNDPIILKTYYPISVVRIFEIRGRHHVDANNAITYGKFFVGFVTFEGTYGVFTTDYDEASAIRQSLMMQWYQETSLYDLYKAGKL